MKVSLEQLSQTLKQQSVSVCIVVGDEVLLKQDACRVIRYAAKAYGASERVSYQIDASFDWQALQGTASTASLFAEKRLIELHFNKVPVVAMQKALQEYVATSSELDYLLISFPKLTAQQQKAKWFQAIAEKATVTIIWPVAIERFPAWLKQRLHRQQLNLNQEALSYLANYTQGNLLAAKQAIEKLLLLYGAGDISTQQLLDAISDGSRHTVFDLIDYILKADTPQITKILQNLQAQDENKIMMLGAITKELRILTELTLANQQTISIIFKKHHVWDKRKPLLQQASRRVSYAQCTQLLQLAAQIDRAIKGLELINVWQALEELSLGMSGKTITCRIG